MPPNPLAGRTPVTQVAGIRSASSGHWPFDDLKGG
jgi:hypothetical protein